MNAIAAPLVRWRWWEPGDFFALGWKRSLLLLLVAMAVSVILFGLFYPYWRKADQDLLLAYEAMLFNQGLPQEDFTHPGYLAFLLIGIWYAIVHAIGLLPVHTVAELPPASSVAAFNSAWQHLIAVGRVLSLLLAGGFVVLFASLLRRFISDWRLGLLGGIALAFSGGIALHSRMMRTELLSATLTGAAFMLVLVAAREANRRLRPPLLALAALSATLAVTTKVQAIIIALAIPVIAQAFGRNDEGKGAAGIPRIEMMWTAAWAVAAVAAAIPASLLYLHGFSSDITPLYEYREIGLLPQGAYQVLFAAWVIAGMAIYARLWRIRPVEMISAMFAVLVGVALGVLALKLRYNDQNLIAFTHPVEQLYFFASWRTTSLASTSQILSPTLFVELAHGVLLTIVAHANLFNRPTVVLEWFAVAGVVTMLRRGDRSLVYPVGVLVAVTWAIEIVFSLRYLNNNYFPYTDPFLITAAALAATRFPGPWATPAAQPNLARAVIVYCVLGSLVSVGLAFDRKGPESACEWLPTYLKRVEPFPFCHAPQASIGKWQAAGET